MLCYLVFGVVVLCCVRCCVLCCVLCYVVCCWGVVFGGQFGHLGGHFGHLGGNFGHLGRHFGHLEGHFWRLGSLLGPLEAILGRLMVVLDLLGDFRASKVLRALSFGRVKGGQVAPLGPQKGAKMEPKTTKNPSENRLTKSSRLRRVLRASWADLGPVLAPS